MSEFLDKSINYDSKAAVKSHLRRCPACGAFIKTFEQTSSMCRRVLRKDAPAGLTQRVMQRIRHHLD
ncbi:MAG: hypothetical protein A2289_11420 [Deltaproteobacteria bacterium RIFOXYA12_FULL_58_15]|nr:MAG: hypothetical protein A2289_11420 [Deltaproteobacteria bacterium RIFOXYA12_FULL_58_15]OGR09692.1 MAG: hypothetical protein A2341_14870 [Deltaproteobacteria bacterium RIFOXYB12_FULL_58_9]